MKDICVLTVVDTISATSMPVNEFVLFRERKDYPYRQVMIVCSKAGDEKVSIPKSIKTIFVGDSKSEFRNQLKLLKTDCEGRGESLVCHLHGQKSAIAFFIASRGLGLRQHTLYTVHSTYSSRDFKYRLSSCICSLLANYANCVSEAAYQEYSPTVKKIKGKKMLPIQNGVDVERIREATAKLPNHVDVADMRKMVCVGRMIPIKNQQFLVRLLKHLPDTELILIGKEDEKIAVLAEEEGVERRVTMTGLIPRDEVFHYLNKCGIYVSASLVEGMPVSVLEAMALGLVPVLSNIAPHEEVAHGCMFIRNLPLVEEEWVKAIKGYQTLSECERKNLSAYIKNSIIQNFSLEKMHERYDAIYYKLV